GNTILNEGNVVIGDANNPVGQTLGNNIDSDGNVYITANGYISGGNIAASASGLAQDGIILRAIDGVNTRGDIVGMNLILTGGGQISLDADNNISSVTAITNDSGSAT